MSTAKVGLCLWGFDRHMFHVEEFLVHSQSLRQLSPAKKGLLLTVGHQKPTRKALVQRRRSAPDLPGETLALGQIDEGRGAATTAAKGGKGMVLYLIGGDLMLAKTHHALC